MRSNQLFALFSVLLFAVSFLVFSGCGGCSSSSSSNSGAADLAEPGFTKATFSYAMQIDNTYLPMAPETVNVYMTETEAGVETIIKEVLKETRVVAGITCVVVRDRMFLDDLLIEDTFDWYTQDDDGHIWHMGEEVINYGYDDEGNLVDTNSDGSWEAGKDVAGVGSIAEPGILITAVPVMGDSYRQEYYEGEAEAMAEVIELDVEVALEDGTVYTGCVKTLEWNPLEQDSEEYKYYAPGVGIIKEETLDGEKGVEIKGTFITGDSALPDFSAAVFTNPTDIDNTYLPFSPGVTTNYEAETEDGTETILVEGLAQTRQVAGITCVVVRDRVYLEGVLIEDTHDWYAHDDEGNVWYMGKEVINYEYDDEGNLVDTNNDGAWETGVDGALPGILMWADPQAKDSYHQEFYEGEAEDMATIVAQGVDVKLKDGTVYENCLQTLEWSPLAPESLEYKYYYPGLGVVKEDPLGSDEAVELVED